MKTMTVVSQVSFQVGHVTFSMPSRQTSRKNCTIPVRRTGAGTGKLLPALSAVFFVASAT
jgi:hypothetical protein